MSFPVEYTPSTQGVDYEANPPIGIDLGTTNSAIARWVNRPRLTGSQVYALNQAGSDNDKHLLNSVVYLEYVDGNEALIVGRVAYKQRIAEPDRVALAFKRTIGNPNTEIQLGDQSFTPIDMSAEVIKALLEDCISQGLRKPEGIVVSVPYYFKQSQKHNTRLAVERAIAETFAALPEAERPPLLELIPEPVAAALNYAFDHLHLPLNQTILTFDLGGGTLDLMLLRLKMTGTKIDFEVLATAGKANFGGEDFDEVLEAYVIDTEAIAFDAQDFKRARQDQSKLRKEIITAKELLSSHPTADISGIQFSDGRYVDTTVSRKEFETLLHGRNIHGRNFGREIEELLDRCLDKARVAASSVTTILPIGGSAQIPFFQQILTNRFAHANMVQAHNREQLLYSVAKGAALYAAYLLDRSQTALHQHLNFDREIALLTRTSHNLGIRRFDGKISVIIPANTPIFQNLPHKAVKHYWPVPSSDPERIHLPEVDIYQGEDGDYTKIGRIPVPTSYTHGREPEEIDIKVEFQVTATTANIQVVIPKGDKEKQDIHLFESIHLESEN